MAPAYMCSLCRGFETVARQPDKARQSLTKVVHAYHLIQSVTAPLTLLRGLHREPLRSTRRHSEESSVRESALMRSEPGDDRPAM